MTFLTNFDRVGEFHRVFEHPIKRTPDVTIFEDNPKLVSLRYSLIEEETKEFIEAVKNKDIVEMIDALADIDYVVYGAGHAFGINMDSMLTLSDLPVPQEVSPQTYFSRTSDGHLNRLCNEFTELLAALKKAIANRNVIDIAVFFLKIVEHTYVVASELGVNLNEAFRLVHASNMTKACRDEDEATQSLEQYLKDTSVYKDPAIKRSSDGKYWIVYDRATGKTLKSKFYKAVDLKPLVSS